MAYKNQQRGARMGRIRGALLGLGLLFASSTAQAQPNESQQEALRLASELTMSIKQVFDGGDLRQGYAEAVRVMSDFAKQHQGTEAWDILRQMVAGEAANLGMHESALEAIGGAGQVHAAPDGLSVVNAIEAIVEESRERRVVMLNEAHHVGLHREFARRLLQPLREAGFTHLACEAFANSDDDGFEVNATKLGFATRETGYYIADPFFAELVREAVELGFELVPYETLDIRPHGQDSPATSVNRRDTSQAQQLAKVLERDPNARLFVYCGYAHLTESEMQIDGEPVLWMAARLRELTGIDPLTVSQTRYYPKQSDLKGDAGIAGYSADDSFVLRGNDGLWSGNPEQFDIELLHPNMEIVAGRPGWMFRADDRSRVRVDLTEQELSEDAVLVVTRAGEGMNAIPSDVVMVHADQQRAALTLREGTYRVWLVRKGSDPELIASPVVN